MPDIAFFRTCIDESFADLLAAQPKPEKAAVKPKPVERPAPKTKTSSKTTPKAKAKPKTPTKRKKASPPSSPRGLDPRPFARRRINGSRIGSGMTKVWKLASKQLPKAT